MLDFARSLVNIAGQQNIECDPDVEDCSALLELDSVSARSLYIIAAVSFFNTVIPELYFTLSTDFEEEYGHTEIDARKEPVIR